MNYTLILLSSILILVIIAFYYLHQKADFDILPKINKRNRPTVVLTYLTGYNDGFGVQLRRLLGIYCVYKEYNFSYLHTPFESVEQGLSSIEKNEDPIDYTKRCNERINFLNSIILSDVIAITKYKIKEKDKPSLRELKKYKKTVVRIQRPDKIIAKYPHILRHLKGIYPTKILKNELFTIGIHVRRGDSAEGAPNRLTHDFTLPDSYYIDTVLRVIKVCNELGIEYIVEIYTEIPNNKIEIKRTDFGDGGPGYETRLIDPKNMNLDKYDIIPNLKKYVNEDLLDTFDRMVNADILICSKSSFSYTASLVSDGFAIFYPIKDFHGFVLYKPIPIKIVRQNITNIYANDDKFEERIEDFIRY